MTSPAKSPSTTGRQNGTKKRSSKKEEEGDEEKEEKKMRGRGSQRTTLPPVNRRLTSMLELESIDLTPIVTMGGVTRRVGGLAVSTPIVKNGIEMGGIKGMRGVKMEKGIDATPTKRGRGRPPSTSPTKLPSQSASTSPLKSPAKSPPTAGRQNGTRERSSKKEEEGDEDKDEDNIPPAKIGRGRAAVKKENGKEDAKKIPSSVSNSRKGQGKDKKINPDSEDEKDDSEEDKEDGVNVRDEKWRERRKDTLLELMKQGSPSCAKHAFREICHLLGKNETWQLLQGYMEELMDTLDHREESTARSLVLLRKAVLEYKDPLLEKIQAIYPVEIARKILVPDPLTYNGGETIGVDTSQMKTMVDIPVSPSMKNTLCAIKLAVRVLPLFPEGEHSNTLIQKTINVLSVCAQEKGMVADDITEADAAWLTAISGSALVRLLSNRRLSTDSNIFKPSLMSALAQVSTHPSEAVRNYFLDRLLKYYRMSVTLTSPFIALIPLSLMAIEKGVKSDEEEKRHRHRVCDIFVQCIQYRYQSLLSMNNNDVLLKNEFFAPHFVSLLAESPRLCNNKDEEELTKITEVLWYCVETLSTRVRGCINWDLIVGLLVNLKRALPKMEKMEDEEDSVDEMAKKVWAISEIFRHLIVYKAKIPITHSEKKAPLLRSFYDTRLRGNTAVYAPTELLKRIEQGKIQHEFNRLKISSTLSKEESKKESKSPIKLSSQSAPSSPLKSPAKSPPTAGQQNGTRKRSSKKEEEGEAETEEDNTPPAKIGRVKKENGKGEAKKIPSSVSNSRNGRGKEKKINAENEDEKEDSEEDKEEEKDMEKPLQT